MKTKGVQVMRKLDKLGMHCSDTAEIHFTDVRVPKRNRIGEEGKGFTYQMLQFRRSGWGGGRLPEGARAHHRRQTIDYTRQRKAFGKPLLDNQVIHFRLAELKTRWSCCARWSIAPAGLHPGEDVTPLATMAKLKADASAASCPTPACNTGAAWAS